MSIVVMRSVCSQGYGARPFKSRLHRRSPYKACPAELCQPTLTYYISTLCQRQHLLAPVCCIRPRLVHARFQCPFSFFDPGYAQISARGKKGPRPAVFTTRTQRCGEEGSASLTSMIKMPRSSHTKRETPPISPKSVSRCVYHSVHVVGACISLIIAHSEISRRGHRSRQAFAALIHPMQMAQMEGVCKSPHRTNPKFPAMDIDRAKLSTLIHSPH